MGPAQAGLESRRNAAQNQLQSYQDSLNSAYANASTSTRRGEPAAAPGGSGGHGDHRPRRRHRHRRLRRGGLLRRGAAVRHRGRGQFGGGHLREGLRRGQRLTGMAVAIQVRTPPGTRSRRRGHLHRPHRRQKRRRRDRHQWGHLLCHRRGGHQPGQPGSASA